MRYVLNLLIVCVTALVLTGCGQKHSKKENKAVVGNPVAPPPGSCPIVPSFNPSKSYLTNLFQATQYDHSEVKRRTGLQERLALLDSCKKERAILQKNSR